MAIGPVEQIFMQSQSGSANGASFFDAFVQGQQGARQDRQLNQADERLKQGKRGLDLEEQLNKARLQDLGAKAIAGQAAIDLQLRQQTLSAPAAQTVQDFIDRGSPPGELGGIAATLANLHIDDPVRKFGMQHLDAMAETYANGARLNKAMKEHGLDVTKVTIDGITATDPDAPASGGDLTSTERNLAGLSKAISTNDKDAITAFERALNIDELEGAQQTVLRSKLSVIAARETARLRALTNDEVLAVDTAKLNAAMDLVTTEFDKERSQVYNELLGAAPTGADVIITQPDGSVIIDLSNLDNPLLLNQP